MIALLLACREPEPSPPALDGPLARFDLRPDAGLLDAPFPSVHHPNPVDTADWPGAASLPWVGGLVEVARTVDGAGTTSGALFSFAEAVPLRPVDVWASVEADAPAFLVAVDGERAGARVPIDLYPDEEGGPFGVSHLLTLLPLQGFPLDPDTTYAAVLRRDLGAEALLGVPPALRDLVAGRSPAGWSADVVQAYTSALSTLDDPEDVAALAVFHTGDPTAELRRFVADARTHPPSPLTEPALTRVYDDFCLFESAVEMPVYQAGDPPYTTEGGAWAVDAAGAPELQATAVSRLWITVPRAPMPSGGFPVAVMVRTGGGGDDPMVDRGVEQVHGGPSEPGTGPALQFARAGFVGVQVDGPFGGPDRNPTGADEQFLMFNIGNPIATRDNVRQSALELALLPPMLDGMTFGAGACPDLPAAVVLDPSTLAILGHSMGATIAPLTLAAAPEYDLAILSGAGGSYLDNLVYKQEPLEVRPIAEALLGYAAIGRPLTEGDPVLQLLQWVSEPADPPAYAHAIQAHVLMEQGIVDHYILPPMANAASLSLGLDLGGEPLDAVTPELASMRPLEPLLPLVDRARVTLPTGGNRDVTRIVVQHPSDGLEDGHEVLFQTEAPKHQYRCLLEDLAAGRVPTVPPDGGELDPCR